MLASETPALSVIGATFVREVAPGEMVVIDADGPAQPRDPVAARRGAAAVHLRVRLHRPARQPALRQGGPRDPLPHGRAAGAPGAGRGRHGDGGARVGRARRRGLRPGQRHPLRAGPGQEPLHRPLLHRARPAGAGRRGAAQAQPADATPSRASGWWWSTTPSCAARRSARSSACCARPGRPRSTCASRRRPGAGPASTASTRPRHEELLATDHTVEEMARILGADSLAYISIENLKAAIGADGGFCDACFTGDYPTPVPAGVGHAAGGPSRSPSPPTRPRSPGSDHRGRGRRHLRRRRRRHRGR